MKIKIIAVLFAITILMVLALIWRLAVKTGQKEVMEQTNFQTTSTTTTIGADKLLYLGHASLKITTREGKVIYIDPYAGDNYDTPADLILVTHRHFDHSAIAKVTNKSDDAQIITWQEALQNGQYHSFDLGYARVEAVEAGYNDYHDVNECVGYIITLSSGVSIYVAGDTYVTPEMPGFAARNLDYAFIPTDGIYTMSVEEASAIADKIAAKHSVPYQMNPNSDFDEDIAARFSAKNKLVIKNGEEIILQGIENLSDSTTDITKVALNSDYEMPTLGLGTFMLSNSQAENSVYHALLDGYRLIDTARIYGNEVGVGKGIKKSGIPREDIFVTTKMWTADYANADQAIDESLARLDLDYIDLMILHHPAANDVDAYKAMERAVKAGKIRSIGLSNYYTLEDFERLVSQVEITPALVQNENHPYYQNHDLQQALAKYGTVVESWYPLGGRGHTQELFNDETISAIAKAHNKSSAQVLLRWHLQAGYIAIPGSSNPDHISENYHIFDFELTDVEMEKIKQLNRAERFSNY